MWIKHQNPSPDIPLWCHYKDPESPGIHHLGEIITIVPIYEAIISALDRMALMVTMFI